MAIETAAKRVLVKFLYRGHRAAILAFGDSKEIVEILSLMPKRPRKKDLDSVRAEDFIALCRERGIRAYIPIDLDLSREDSQTEVMLLGARSLMLLEYHQKLGKERKGGEDAKDTAQVY